MFTLVFMAVFFYNIIDQITKGQNIIERLPYTALFLVFAAITLIFKSKYVISIILIIIASGLLLDPRNPLVIAIVSAFLYYSAFHLLRNNKKLAIPIGSVSLFFYSTRAIQINGSIPNTLMMFVGVAFIYLLCYYIYFKTAKTTVKSKIPSLTALENDLIADIASGLSQKEAIANRGLTSTKGYDIIRNIKEKMDTPSIPKITHELGISKNRP